MNAMPKRTIDGQAIKGGASASGERAGVVARALVEAIVEQRLAPATKLVEDELGQIFGVSRTIVRAALQDLAKEGLVDVRPNRGAVVASPTIDEARQVFEARRVIETALVRDACLHRTAADLAGLRAHLKTERAALKGGDRSSTIRLSGDFHLRLATIARQPVLARFVGELVARSALVIALYGQSRASSCGTTEHEGIVKAIAAGDAEDAARLVEYHLRHIESDLTPGTVNGKAPDLAAVLRGTRAP